MNYLSRWSPAHSLTPHPAFSTLSAFHLIPPPFQEQGAWRGGRGRTATAKKRVVVVVVCLYLILPYLQWKTTIIDNLTFGTAAAPFEMKCLDYDTYEIPRGLFFFLRRRAVLYCSGKLPFLHLLFLACLPIWTMVLRLNKKVEKEC